MIELKFFGSAELVRDEMRTMLGLLAEQTTKDKPEGEEKVAIVMNADTAAALETPVIAPETPVEAQAEKGKETVAEAAEKATAKPDSKPAPPAKPTPTEAAIDEANGVMGFSKPDESVPPVATPAGAPAAGITLVQARERMNGLRQKFGAKAVRQVLDSMGYPKFTDVPEEQYGTLMVLCDAMEKGMTNA